MPAGGTSAIAAGNVPGVSFTYATEHVEDDGCDPDRAPDDDLPDVIEATPPFTG